MIRLASPPDLDPEDAFAVTVQAYADALGVARVSLKNDRQRDGFDSIIGPRFDADMLSARADADRRFNASRIEQDGLIQRNAARDAIDHFRQPDLFAKHLETGAESVRLESMQRGDAPTVTAAWETAFRSSVHRGVVDALEQDPVGAATYYMRQRLDMTASDRSAVEAELYEPLARALATRDVDDILLSEADISKTQQEQEDVAAHKIEAEDWTDVRKRYAGEELTRRSLREAQDQKQKANAAKEAALAEIQRLGPHFISLAQLTSMVRRDLDEETQTALARQAERNLAPVQAEPQGFSALKLNLLATYHPADFAALDLRLLRDLVTPEEYDTFVRQRQAIGGYPASVAVVTQQRLGRMVSGGAPPAGPGTQERPRGSSFVPAAWMQDGGSFAQDRAVALDFAEKRGGNPADILQNLKGLPARATARPPKQARRVLPTADTDAIKAGKMSSPPSRPTSHNRQGLRPGEIHKDTWWDEFERTPVQRLMYQTRSGGGPNDSSWAVRWVLGQESVKGGWIVQRVVVRDASGHVDEWIYEAWKVPAGSRFTEFGGNNQDFWTDDTFMRTISFGGRSIVRSRANFLRT